MPPGVTTDELPLPAPSPRQRSGRQARGSGLTGRGVVAFVFARGGSKGLPGKNLLPLGDRPLIAHAVGAARAVPCIDRVVVSTDDPQIAEVARKYGAEVPWLRPADLAQDSAPEWAAWQHAVRETVAEHGEFDTFVSVPATAPLREVSDVEGAIELFLSTDADLVLTGRRASQSPWFNLVAVDPDGLVRLAAEGADPISRRQDGPVLFDITPVCYVSTPEFILRASGMWEGRVRLFEVPKERSIDIDDAFDFTVARLLYEHARTDPPE